MFGPDDLEVSTVEREHNISAEPLGEDDHGCVGSSQPQVCVLLDEIRDARPVSGSRSTNVEVGKPAEQLRFDLRPAAMMEDERCFRDA